MKTLVEEKATNTTESINGIFINAFLNGTIHTLKVQCSYEVSPLKSYLFNSNEPVPSEICGVIGLTSNVFRGTITLCFSEKVFLDVMGSMFGETFSEITDELSDGAGELLNIIFGAAKTTLTERGHSVEKAIPTVVRGKNIKISSLTGGGTTIVVPFDHKGDRINVLISLGKPQTDLRLVK